MPALLPSELPVVARVRHHWIVLLKPPNKYFGYFLVALLLAGVFDPNPFIWIFLLVAGVSLFVRWQSWRAEWIILTQRRLIRIRGIPETTSSEASLRLDRVSGAVLEQTVWGKILNYGSIELEAAGQHPDVRELVKIAHPTPFYLQVRRMIFGEEYDLGPPPAEDPNHPDHITEPIPHIRPGDGGPPHRRPPVD